MCSCVENVVSDNYFNYEKSQKWESRNLAVLVLLLFAWESWHSLTTLGVALVNYIERDTIVWRRKSSALLRKQTCISLSQSVEAHPPLLRKRRKESETLFYLFIFERRNAEIYFNRIVFLNRSITNHGTYQ